MVFGSRAPIEVLASRWDDRSSFSSIIKMPGANRTKQVMGLLPDLSGNSEGFLRCLVRCFSVVDLHATCVHIAGAPYVLACGGPRR